MLLLGGWTEWPGLSALPVPPLPDSMPRCRSLRFLGIGIQSLDPAFGSPALPIAKGSAPAPLHVQPKPGTPGCAWQ